MAITDTLSDIWHGLEDKAWSVADFLEDKGIPLASFCQSKGISPLILFIGIILLIIVLFALLGGAAAGGQANLTVTVVDANGNGIQTSVNIAWAGGTPVLVRTSLDGKVTEKVPFTTVTITIQDPNNRYTGSASVQVTKDPQQVTVTAQTVTGTLRVILKNTASGYISTGTIEIKDYTTGTVKGTATVNGADKYDFEVPVGTYRVIVKSVSGGELKNEIKQVSNTGVTTIEFTISADAANSASVRVIAKDENGILLQNVHVILRNGRNDNTIGSELTTDAAGQVTFGNIAMGTSVYPLAWVPNDRRYGQLTEYESKNNPNYKITVDEMLETIQITLPLNGRVEVVVWDDDSHAYIAGAQVTIMDKGGTQVSSAKPTDSQGKAIFTGFEENLEVYPYITAQGFKPYDGSNAARPVLYTTATKFNVGMERDGSYISSKITINVKDAYNEALGGVTAVLSDVDGNFIRKLNATDNVSFDVDATKLYNVALYKPGYLRKVIEGIGPGSQEAQLLQSNNANAGDVRVCTYLMINGVASEAASTVELFLGTGAMIDKDDTTGGSDGDNCVTFPDLPQEWSVFARATADSYTAVESEVTEVIPRQDGITLINLTFNQLPANAALTGDIKVCVTSETNNPITGAEVLLYDADIEAPTWSNYRMSTTSDGCALFAAIPTEKTGYDGVLTPVIVYAIVSSPNYATYNGKLDGNTVQVQPLRVTPLNVRLSSGESICIAVENGGSPLMGADVSLCANAACSQIMETQQTQSDGHALFSSAVTSVTVKVVANVDSILKQTTASFSLSQVTQGQCGSVNLASITHYTSLTIDGSSYISVMPNAVNESIDFLVFVDGVLATGSSNSNSGQNIVYDANNTEVLIGLTGVTPGIIQTIDAANGKYSLPFTAPSAYGSYTATLTASINGCSTCQGDQEMVTIEVGAGDSDGDGVPDSSDNCPGTPAGTTVDVYGCPTASTTDSDGDGVPDDSDNCPGTAAGVQVYADGCPVPTVADADGDGVPDSLDAFPNDATQWYPTTTADTVQTSTGPMTTAQLAQMYQSSIEICIVDELGAPVYDSSIILYHTGARSGYSATTGYGTTPYGSTGGMYGSPTGGYGTTTMTGYGSNPAYSQPVGYGTTGAASGMYSGYGQQWQSTYNRDNCRVFAGYTSTQGLYLDTFFTSFYVKVDAKGYESYDSSKGDRTNVRLRASAGTAGSMFGIDIILKRGKGAKMGQGSMVDPARTVELRSADWKAEQAGKGAQTKLSPLVTEHDRYIDLLVKYTVEETLTADLQYTAKYTLSGTNCYYIEDTEGAAATAQPGGRIISFGRGQGTVEDYVMIKSKDNCWDNNEGSLETPFTLNMEGELKQIGDKESTAKTKFTPARVTLEPLVGALKEVNTISDLTKLKNQMEFKYGVVTIGNEPYCITDKAKTSNSKFFSGSSGEPNDKAAAKHKILIKFNDPSSQLPTTMNSLVEKIQEYIRTKIKKSPVDCKAYVKVTNKYKGFVEVGQTGSNCHDAQAQYQVPGTATMRQADPWQKMFCDLVTNGVQQQIALGGSYAMKVDSK